MGKRKTGPWACTVGEAGGLAYSGELVSKLLSLLGRVAALSTWHNTELIPLGSARIHEVDIGLKCELREPASVEESEVF